MYVVTDITTDDWHGLLAVTMNVFKIQIILVAIHDNASNYSTKHKGHFADISRNIGGKFLRVVRRWWRNGSSNMVIRLNTDVLVVFNHLLREFFENFSGYR